MRSSDGAGPLTPYVAGFRAELARLGYSMPAANRHMVLMAHLGRWLQHEGLEVAAVATAATEEFFAVRRNAGYVNLRTIRSLAPLTGYLRSIGVLGKPQAQAPAGPVETLLADYRSYLLRQRGLVEGSVRFYVRLARLFVSERIDPPGLSLADLAAADVVDFVGRICEHRGLSSSRQVISALRSFLRYLQLQGITAVALDQAVLSVAGGAPSLPTTLSQDHVQRLLESCDRGCTIGRRDHAILLLLARLGLRAGEVLALQLGDINWRAGELVVRGKRDRRDRLPLPTDVGEALADYLRWDRPSSESRRVFLRHYAPWTGLQVDSGAVGGVVARACERAHQPFVSPHCLRHTLASELLRRGGSLDEIGDVLPHRGRATTAVYAQIDLDRLATLAPPWPGGAA